MGVGFEMKGQHQIVAEGSMVFHFEKDDRDNPLIYDIYDFGLAYGTPLSWNWNADQGRQIQGCVSNLISFRGVFRV